MDPFVLVLSAGRGRPDARRGGLASPRRNQQLRRTSRAEVSVRDIVCERALQKQKRVGLKERKEGSKAAIAIHGGAGYSYVS